MIELVPLDDLKDLEEGIEEMSERFPGLGSEDTWDRLGAGIYLPYSIWKDGEDVGKIIVQPLEHPPELHLIYMLGGGFILNMQGQAALKKLGKALGCCDNEGRVRMRFSSPRPEWRKVVERFGFHEVSTNYVAELGG